MRQWVVLVLLVGMVSGGVLNWLGMVDVNEGTEHLTKDAIYRKDDAVAKQNKERQRDLQDVEEESDEEEEETYEEDNKEGAGDEEVDITDGSKNEDDNENEEDIDGKNSVSEEEEDEEGSIMDDEDYSDFYDYMDDEL